MIDNSVENNLIVSTFLSDKLDHVISHYGMRSLNKKGSALVGALASPVSFARGPVPSDDAKELWAVVVKHSFLRWPRPRLENRAHQSGSDAKVGRVPRTRDLL
jgi:hypothetical protein